MGIILLIVFGSLIITTGLLVIIGMIKGGE